MKLWEMSKLISRSFLGFFPNIMSTTTFFNYLNLLMYFA